MVMNSLNLHLFEKVFILTSVLKDGSAEYSRHCWQDLMHSMQACEFSIENYAGSLIGISLRILAQGSSCFFFFYFS